MENTNTNTVGAVENTEQTEYKLQIDYYNTPRCNLNRLCAKPTLHKMVISLFLLD